MARENRFKVIVNPAPPSLDDLSRAFFGMPFEAAVQDIANNPGGKYDRIWGKSELQTAAK